MSSKFYTVPGGVKLFFQEGTGGAAGLGYRDFGNLSALGLSSTIEKLEHFSNRSGQRQKDAEAVQSSSMEIKFSFDEPNPFNLRWSFLGGTMTDVNAGSYQVVRELVELTAFTPKRVALDMAVAPAVVVEAVAGSPTTYINNTDYTLDAVNSTIARKNGGAIDDGEFVMVTYNAQLPAHKSFPVLESPIINGAARLLIFPTDGQQILWEIPSCSIAPDGDFSLDDQDWMTAAMILTLLADTENSPNAPFGTLRTWNV